MVVPLIASCRRRYPALTVYRSNRIFYGPSNCKQLGQLETSINLQACYYLKEIIIKNQILI